jgi:hypothetical protein
MRRARSFCLVAVLLSAGCATIPPRAELTPPPWVIDPAIVGEWSDARMTQLGPAWIHLSLGADCISRARIQLLFTRITMTSRYQAREGAVTFFETSRDWRCPYRLIDGHLELQEAADERNTYSRSPSLSDRQPHRGKDAGAGQHVHQQARDEVGIDHEHEAGDELRRTLLLLAVDEQHEPDPARQQREKQHARIE